MAAGSSAVLPRETDPSKNWPGTPIGVVRKWPEKGPQGGLHGVFAQSTASDVQKAVGYPGQVRFLNHCEAFLRGLEAI